MTERAAASGKPVGNADLTGRARPVVARPHRVSTHRRVELDTGWEMAHGSSPSEWLPAIVPGTVAASLRAAGQWSFSDARDFDAEEWWYRCEFGAEPQEAVGEAVLLLQGLATVAEVWLNDVHVATSRSMFVAQEVAVGDLLRERNRLVLRFAPLYEALDAAPRVPRARWRTQLVQDSRLRFVRTTLLGRMPSWTPPVPGVGPWRPIALEYRPDVRLEAATVRVRLDGDDGVVDVSLSLLTGGSPPASAELRVADCRGPLALRLEHPGCHRVEGVLRIPGAPRWWPSTHGDQPLFPAQIRLTFPGAGEVMVDLGRVGFCEITVDGDEPGGFALRVNGTSIFARGACWTPLDVCRLWSSPEEYRTALRQVREGGMNMVRVAGTMTYEADDFHAACDELGILVWQDGMFASMDYPTTLPDFAASVEEEMRQLLGRLGGHVSTAVVCGGSETVGQPAMLGLPPDRWQSSFFSERLPQLAASLCPGAVYVPSSPWGGALPFAPETGLSHYYGVGAFMRPLSDARTSRVRFASECLGFANVPEPSTCELVPGGSRGVGHAPAWKARVHRDAGASWDLEDARDHYLEQVFGVKARELRVTDVERYLALSRVVSAMVMARVMWEWRRPESSCNGALVWLLRDLWPGAGCGIIDSTGSPKAAYYALKRTFAPVAVLVEDEGLNGLYVYLVNDSPVTVAGILAVDLFRGARRVEGVRLAAAIAPRHFVKVHVDEHLGAFRDTTYAYRFGPPGHDLTSATLRDVGGELVSEAFHFPHGVPSGAAEGFSLRATAAPLPGDGAYELTITTSQFAQSVAIDVPGFKPDDSYFHVAPGGERRVRLRPIAGPAVPDGYVWPLNAQRPVRIEVTR